MRELLLASAHGRQRTGARAPRTDRVAIAERFREHVTCIADERSKGVLEWQSR